MRHRITVQFTLFKTMREVTVLLALPKAMREVEVPPALSKNVRDGIVEKLCMTGCRPGKECKS